VGEQWAWLAAAAQELPQALGINRLDGWELSSQALATCNSLLFPSLLMDIHRKPRDYYFFLSTNI